MVAACSAPAEEGMIRVGSKSFTENYILGEIVAQLIEKTGEARVERSFGLGQTGIVAQALKNAQIDLIPEYTGTIAEAYLPKTSATSENQKLAANLGSLQHSLNLLGLQMTSPLGFDNTYGLAVRSETAKLEKLTSLSSLEKNPPLRAGFSHEFLNRPDGLPRLMAFYPIRFRQSQGLSHALAYEAIRRQEIDVTDAYSTDAMIQRLGLVMLIDDKRAFPDYRAVLLARSDLSSRFPRTWKALQTLGGRISVAKMREMNAMAEQQGMGFPAIATQFLGGSVKKAESRGDVYDILTLTYQHLVLVLISLGAAIAVGLPLAIWANRSPTMARIVLVVSEIVQTIPSLALLCFLIPLFGIGNRPALVALFLYGLLPIVRSSYTGLHGIDPRLEEVATAMALSRMQRLLWIELPLASPHILDGIKTSAVINVGTATLAALIGAGGYGVPIVTGLALNNTNLILKGAVPAAVMAILAHLLFEFTDRWLIPKGLRH